AAADRVPSDARAPSDLLGRPQVLADGTLAMSGGVGSVGAPPPLSPTGATLAAPAAGTDGLGASSTLAEDGIPTTALDAYRRAADGAPHSCHLDWTLIAAIGRVESDHGRFA